MSDDNEDYNSTNRAFLQAFIARSTLTYEEAKPILAEILTAYEKRDILTEDVTEADFNLYISKANRAISPYDLEIRHTLHQTTRTKVYALVNSTSDPITQLATSYIPEEINFLKRVLDMMFERNNKGKRDAMVVTSMEALRVSRPVRESRSSQAGTDTQRTSDQGLTLTQAEKMLSSLVAAGWFEMSKKGYYTLSPRTLIELRGWLIETYNDISEDEDSSENETLRVAKIKFCHACREIVTMGQRCSNIGCLCRLHEICTQNFFRVQNSRTCPLCKADWAGETFVGERAHRDYKPEGQRGGGASNGVRRGTQNGAAAEPVETVEMESDEEVEPSSE